MVLMRSPLALGKTLAGVSLASVLAHPPKESVPAHNPAAEPWHGNAPPSAPEILQNGGLFKGQAGRGIL